MGGVRIYVEGGGDSEDGKRALRRAFSHFLRETEGWRPRVIACGSRGAAHDKFVAARTDHPDDFVVLLVDAEGAVSSPAREHLGGRDGWRDLLASEDERIHLMVQAVEAWFLADKPAVAAYYGTGFQQSALPNTAQLESVPKDQLKPALERAGLRTPKGGYHELRDGAQILERIDPAKVRAACPSCRRLFDSLCDHAGVPRLP